MVYVNNPQTDFNNYQSLSPKRKKFRIFAIAGGVILGALLIFNFGFGENNIFISNDGEEIKWGKLPISPERENSRFDVLILGVRGKDDPNAGLLTDTIMIYSVDKKTGRSALISVPRDLYVEMEKGSKQKINEAYVTGLSKGNGKDFVKELMSKLTGIYIDNVVVFDFSSFEKIIDQLGGVDITLAKPFEESTQWGYEFYLPAGENHLNGQNALYYVRSRYSSSDFDRAQRQQQILLAIKGKVTRLNIITDPIKSLQLLNTVKKNIDTDFNVGDIGSLLRLANEVNARDVSHYVLSTENVLYQTHINGIYVLMPRNDNFNSIHQLFQDVINGEFEQKAQTPQNYKPTEAKSS